ncbi:MAG: TRAP transporter small permease [Deltaproteobacteria bacterium]|nr:TRAP transporter small permease [Deltaproteobacteria bacterium]
MKALQKAEYIFDKIIDCMLTLAAAIVVLDALAVSMDVILRKVIGFTWAPLYEIITYSLLWMTFLGATAIMRKNGHVKMDSITSILSPKNEALLNVISHSICILVAAIMLFYTIKLTTADYQANFILASILNPPKWPIEIIIPIGFFMLFLQLIRNTRDFYKRYSLLSDKEEPDNKRSHVEKVSSHN